MIEALIWAVVFHAVGEAARTAGGWKPFGLLLLVWFSYVVRWIRGQRQN